MGRRERDFNRAPQPKKEEPWTPPTKSEKLAAKQVASQERSAPSEALDINTQLSVASMDNSLVSIDLHGMTRDDVEIQVDALLANCSGEIVRIIYGHGQGVIAGEVMRYLRSLSGGKNARVQGFREDDRRASVVVKVR